MHTIEPYYNWLDFYDSSNDHLSPFYQKEYDQFQFSEKIYDHFIHPQWDNIGSSTLFIKTLFSDYDLGFAVIEMMGEWNDCLHNDIMIFKRNIIEHFMLQGISKFILVGEYILTFHTSDDCYYEELFDEVEDEDGWVALLNFQNHVLEDFENADIDHYFVLGGQLNELNWRTYQPRDLFKVVEKSVMKRLG